MSGTVKLTEVIARLTRERDEARAEVERLREVLDEVVKRLGLREFLQIWRDAGCAQRESK